MLKIQAATMNTVVLHYPPAALQREQAAAYAGLSVSTFEKEVRQRRAPQPRQVAGRRVAWLRQELDAWLNACPISTQLPPENTSVKKSRHPP